MTSSPAPSAASPDGANTAATPAVAAGPAASAPGTGDTGRTDRLPLFRGPYPAWLASDTGTALSASLAGFAIPLLALMVTGDPAQAGVIGAVGLAVRAASTLVGGVLADRRNRITLMIIGGLLGTVLATAFVLLSLGQALGFSALLLLNALMAARNGVFGVAASAALKDVVPATSLGRAQAANQGRDAVLALAGAPLGGILLGIGGWLVGAAMVLCQLVATFSALTLRGLKRRNPAAPTPVSGETGAEVTPADEGTTAKEGASEEANTASQPRASGTKNSAATDLKEAFVWLWRRPDLRGALLVCTIVNLGFNAVVTTVLYSLQQAGHTPATIGLVSMGIGMGMLAGAVVAPALVSRVPAGTLTGVGLVLVTLAACTLPLLNNVAAIATVLAVGMAGTPALNASLLGYFMVATPSHLMGRANSVLELFATGAMPLAPLIAGLGLSLWGREETLLLGGALCAVATVLAIGTPSLRRIPKEAHWVTHAQRFADMVPAPVSKP